jgi:catechol 2,3-dioxygenase-like lactoylglutathione lyase family enzyme
MTTVQDLFHVAHVVDDLAEAEAWYDTTFSPVYLFRHHDSILDQRTASMMLIADFPPEPMAPFPTPAGTGGNIGRFHGRFGSRLHSIAFYSTEIPTVYERLRSRGVRVLGDGGARLDGPPSRGAIYTHPRDTYGLIELMEPRIAGQGGAPVGDVLGECYDTRLTGTHNPQWWEAQHPLGIVRTSHLTVLVDDLDAASSLYGDVLDGRPFHETHGDADRLFMLIGPTTVIELRQPREGTEEAAHLDRDGGMLWSVTFLVTDLEAAAEHLLGTGTAPTASEGELHIPAPSAFGARYNFANSAVPNDPRDQPSEGMA